MTPLLRKRCLFLVYEPLGLSTLKNVEGGMTIYQKSNVTAAEKESGILW